ncbi:hypothetical protein TNCT_233631 [Trichonephila clavata]|uniref:Uncharacterized protein n=1 Tax=Trichonephila clavata TaxID=2740835 RepID=A0A8X6G1Q8_TRICU|nr:hypothetical protein TNCT_233631 [Trichonephila clavata]
MLLSIKGISIIVKLSSKYYSHELWDLPAGKLRTEFKGHSSGVSDIEFHPNELLSAVVALISKYVKFWDLENHRLVSNTDGDSGPVQ